MNKKAIFFDNDGVLVDTEKYYFQATKEILSEVGIHITRDDFIKYFLKQSKGAWHLVKAKGYSDSAIANLRERRNELYNELLKKENLIIPGVEKTIKTLAKDFKLAIVTSSRADHFNTIHQSTNILSYFNFILTREDYKNSKPDPEPYLLAHQKSGLTKNECIIVEDSERGLEAAKAANIDCIAIPTELTESCEFDGAIVRLNSIIELLDYLL
ncbi:MAG: HAD family phosphatase [Bacteroidetes bacterium]|nr:HAD family phosphatase [Bacteroidota bacterium]